MAPDLNVLALVKGQEQYVFVYDDVSLEALIDAFRDQAADPNLTLNWFDVAVLTEKARQQVPSPSGVRHGTGPRWSSLSR